MKRNKHKGFKTTEADLATGKTSNPEKLESNSEDEDEKPKGGCPFMGTSSKKKNPGLNMTEEGFD